MTQGELLAIFKELTRKDQVGCRGVPLILQQFSLALGAVFIIAVVGTFASSQWFFGFYFFIVYVLLGFVIMSE